MFNIRFIGLVFFLFTTGCAIKEHAPSESSAPPAQPTAAEPSTTGPATPGAAKAESANAKSAKSSAQPAAKKPGTAPGSTKPPSLDLTALERRLKETKAIGVFTKITLKNQVDDLLNQFRAHYQGQARTTLADLRQPYDRLLLKVLSLLQDGDPELARAIVASREEIWGILSDPKKFATLST